MVSLFTLLLGRTAAAASSGLTITHFSNTALAGGGDSSTVVASVSGLADCDGHTCGKPSSMRLTGRVAPPVAGNYGFKLAFDPPLPFPSEEAYARLWVHDHLLFPVNIGNSSTHSLKPGGGAPLWIPLPPRALDAEMRSIEHAGSLPLSSYEIRLEYVCLAAAGCGKRKISLTWATFAARPAQTPSSASRPVQRALLTTQVHPGSR